MMSPLTLEEDIPSNHPVRVVNKVIDQIGIQPLLNKFKAGGTSSFHPRMLLDLLVFAYINIVYIRRKIEERLQQNIHFMWLSAMNTSAPLPRSFAAVAGFITCSRSRGMLL